MCNFTSVGPCGSNLSWSLSPDGVLTISGTGDMVNFSSNSVPWNDDKDKIASVIVEDGVTGISSKAFCFCSKLISVLLPESVTDIGSACFASCGELRFINIPHGITAIQEATFLGCHELASLVLPDGLVSIDRLAFAGCRSLREINIPASVMSISDDNVFKNCKKLEEITVAKGTSSYTSEDGILFSGDKTTLICYPAGKNDVSYTVPGSVTHLADYAFDQNENIRGITISASVKAIGSNCFTECSELTNLVVSNVADSLSSYKSVNGVLFTSDMSTLVAYPAGRKDCSYVIPDGVTTVGEYAFSCNHNITSVTFPDSLVTINCYAFSSCDGLTSVVLPASVRILGAGAFDLCNNLVNVTVMNPSMIFDPCDVFYGIAELVLTGAAGSTTEAYAHEEGLKFIAATTIWRRK